MGASNVGKSFFIYKMLQDLFENDQVYETYTVSSGPTERTFSTFDSSKHRVIIDNEFRLQRYDVELLKRLMEGGVVKIRSLFQEAFLTIHCIFNLTLELKNNKS